MTNPQKGIWSYYNSRHDQSTMGIDPMNNISIIIRIHFAVTLFQQRGISGLLEQVVVIVFSLLLEETMNLAMLPFISIFHIFLQTLFFIITSISSA
jgi:hypothetical protein